MYIGEFRVTYRGLFRAKIRISFHLLGIELSDETKSARSRKGERAEEACLMLLPDLLFPSVEVIGSCVMRKGSRNMGEDADIDFEANLLARGCLGAHDF